MFKCTLEQLRSSEMIVASGSSPRPTENNTFSTSRILSGGRHHQFFKDEFASRLVQPLKWARSLRPSAFNILGRSKSLRRQRRMWRRDSPEPKKAMAVRLE